MVQSKVDYDPITNKTPEWVLKISSSAMNLALAIIGLINTVNTGDIVEVILGIALLLPSIEIGQLLYNVPFERDDPSCYLDYCYGISYQRKGNSYKFFYRPLILMLLSAILGFCLPSPHNDRHGGIISLVFAGIQFMGLIFFWWVSNNIPSTAKPNQHWHFDLGRWATSCGFFTFCFACSEKNFKVKDFESHPNRCCCCCIRPDDYSKVIA